MKKILSDISPSHITFKLSLFVSIVVVIAFSLLETYNLIIIKSDVRQKILDEQYTQAKFIAKDIHKKLEKRTRFIDRLTDTIPDEIVHSQQKLQQYLHDHFNLTNFFPQGYAVIPTDGQGVFIESPVLPGRNQLSFSKSEWFIRAKQSKQVVVSKPFLGRAYKKVIIIIAKAITDDSGQVLAVLETPIILDSPGFMDYIFDPSHRPQGDILVISRENQIFIATSKSKMLLKSTPKPNKNLFHDKVMQGFNGHANVTNAFGVKMLAAAADIGTPDWFVVVRTPVHEVYNTINKQFTTGLVNGLLVSIMAVLTISLALFLFFIPLRQAAKSVREMVHNNKPLSHIKVVNNDEIGDLISGFNALIDKVNEQNIILKKANTELETLSQTDGLTGVPNRRSFDHTLSHWWKLNTRRHQPLTLLLLDIDHFKKFNDKYGHITGDDCLKEVAKTLQNTIKRPTDFFSRYGGEEFVILLQGDINEGVAVAEKARTAISELNIAHSESNYQRITISLGIASLVPSTRNKMLDLVEHADQALYQSKHGGRNCYQCYSKDPQTPYVDYGEFI